LLGYKEYFASGEDPLLCPSGFYAGQMMG
jgi:hypothetical protein